MRLAAAARFRVTWLILLGIAWPGGVGAAGLEKSWRPVRGNELQALFADQNLGDEVHFANQFHRDGRLTGTDMGKPARGNWNVAGQRLCWTWSRPASPEECYEIRQRGHEVRLFRDGYEAFSGTLTPLTTQSKEVKP